MGDRLEDDQPCGKKKESHLFQHRLFSDFLTLDRILATIRSCLEDMTIGHCRRQMTWRSTVARTIGFRILCQLYSRHTVHTGTTGISPHVR
jgi:hypothetical protein